MITALQAKTSKVIDLGFSEREARQYSVAKAILSTTDTMTPGGFEVEVSQTLSSQLGRPARGARGIFVPTKIAASGLATTTNAAGGYTTAPQVQDLTDIFRSQLRLVQLGATFIGGLKYNALFPSEDSSTTAYWVTENGLVDVSESNPVFRANLASPLEKRRFAARLREPVAYRRVSFSPVLSPGWRPDYFGIEEVDRVRTQTEHALQQYVALAHRLHLASDYRMDVGTEAVATAEQVCREVAREFPRAVFFAGKLVFEHERWYQRLLHNETAYALQRRLQFAGLNAMVLPVRVLAEEAAAA